MPRRPIADVVVARCCEIRVDGPVGPVAASVLRGFTTVEVVTTTTLLTGILTDAEGLVALFTVLNEHGFSPIDIVINTPTDQLGVSSPSGEASGLQADTPDHGGRQHPCHRPRITDNRRRTGEESE